MCQDVTVQERLPERDGSVGGTVVGAVVGGLLGNQVGGGNGKKAATAAGGGRWLHRQPDRQAPRGWPRGQPHRAPVPHRDRHLESSRVTGYNVTYRNEDGTTGTMASKPGNRIAMGTNDVVKGYNVTYRYDGAEKTVRMDNKPASDRLPVVDGQLVTQTAAAGATAATPVIQNTCCTRRAAHAGPFRCERGHSSVWRPNPPSWWPLRHGVGMSIFDLRLETERLILRPLREDYEPYLAFCADEETMRTLGGVQPPSVAWRGFCSLAGAAAAVRLLDVQRDRKIQRGLDRADGPLARRTGRYRVGWGIRRASWGRGYKSGGRGDRLGLRHAGLARDPYHRREQRLAGGRAQARQQIAAHGRRLATTSRCRSGASRASSGGNARAERCLVVPAGNHAAAFVTAGQRPFLRRCHAASALSIPGTARLHAAGPAGSDGAGNGGRSVPDGAWHVGLEAIATRSCLSSSGAVTAGWKWTVARRPNFAQRMPGAADRPRRRPRADRIQRDPVPG